MAPRRKSRVADFFLGLAFCLVAGSLFGHLLLDWLTSP